MKHYHSLVREVLEATRIVSPTGYRWFDQLDAPLPPRTEAAMAPADARQFLRHALKNRLYADFYCPGRARPAAGHPPGSPQTTPFLEALSSANHGQGSRDPGWRVVRNEDAHIVVERHGLQIWARPEEVSAPDAAVGERLSLKLPKELLRLSPGFYMALGDHEFASETVNQLRFYWNIAPDGAVPLMQALTSRLNAAGIAYRFKVVADSASYTRCDAGVLYGSRDDEPRLSALVGEVYLHVRGWIKPATPAFTEERAPGLGFAESPEDPNESFGTARCELLADAMIDAWQDGATDVDARLDIVERRFAAAGLSLAKPYVNPVTAPQARHE